MGSQFSYLYDKHELDNVGSNESYVDYNNGFMFLGIVFLVVLLMACLPRKKHVP
jgi:CTP:phosphocholine cytidylyltransferase-like protein